MEQQELINKIKTLLPQEKEHRVFECNGAYNGRGCFENFCDVKTCISKDKINIDGYNQALLDIYKALPDIINYIYEDLRGKIKEKSHLTKFGNGKIIEVMETGFVLNLLEIIDK